MTTIKKDTLHPENEPEVDIYPKTSIDQVENLQANLDALNGDIANANGEIANISANVETIANRVEIAENSITVLTTAYESYTDYTKVTNGFLLTYLSGRQIELPIKAGTNVTFSKYPGTNQIVINATGGSAPDNIALLDANNTFSGSNTFNNFTYFNKQINLNINPISFNDDTKNMSLVFNYNGFIKRFVDTGNVYSINIPNKTGTIALTTDIPTLADYPTTIFFNNYKAGIGYKDTSTGTTKTVVSTDNNGAQIVLGDSNTGLTLATNARPKVLEDSTVKEVAYVSDIPAAPDNIALLDAANTFSAENTFNQTTYYNNRVFFENSPINLRDSTKKILLTLTYDGFLNSNRGTGDTYSYSFPNKTGTFAVTTDIPNYNSVAGVSYDTTNGAVISYTNGKLITIPIKAGDGVTIDADTTNQNILISAPGGGSSTPQYNRGMGNATPTTFAYELGVYHTLTITLLTTYVSTTIILSNDYDGSSINIELEGKSFLIMVVAGLLSVRNTTDNTEWVGKLE